MFPLKKALPIAERVIEKLKPHAQIILIAGSIRREKPEVKDIELVVIPKKEVIGGQADLFGTSPKAERRITPGFTKTVGELGRHIKGFPSGRYVQLDLPEKIKLDLFIPQEEDFYRQFAIRTGSAEYAQKTLAAAWIRKGWRGTDRGLRLETECHGTPLPENKMKWECISMNPTLPPVWQSEKELFDWLGIQYLAPKYRTI